MFLCLAFQTRFEVADGCINHENGEVGLTDASDHVGNKVSMVWCVEDSEFRPLRLQVVSGDVDGYSPRSFFRALVENLGEGK